MQLLNPQIQSLNKIYSKYKNKMLGTFGNIGTFSPGLNANAIVGEYWTVDPCEFIYGCTDPLALNYDPTAGVDNGTCIHIPGCMDSTACNYDPLANTDNGSCDFSCYGCTDPTASNYDPKAQLDYDATSTTA